MSTGISGSVGKITGVGMCQGLALGVGDIGKTEAMMELLQNGRVLQNALICFINLIAQRQGFIYLLTAQTKQMFLFIQVSAKEIGIILWEHTTEQI